MCKHYLECDNAGKTSCAGSDGEHCALKAIRKPKTAEAKGSALPICCAAWLAASEMIRDGAGFCVECGIVPTDEDGCCTQCGALAQGRALKELSESFAA